MKVDMHNHTTFSPDGSQTPFQLVAAALDEGVKYLAVTEHLDNEYPIYDGDNFDFLVNRQYFDELGKLRIEFGDRINLLIGIEVGWTRSNERKNAADIAHFPYEYIINSVHVVNGTDVYRPEFMERRGKHAGYEMYLEAVYQSLFAPYAYDTVGHLGYAARYAAFDDNRMLYQDHAEIFDGILRTVIEKEKILEINSAVGNSGSLTSPDESVLRRYFELGGRKITFASDSHRTSRLLHNYDEIAALVREIGFFAWTVKTGGKHFEVKI